MVKTFILLGILVTVSMTAYSQQGDEKPVIEIPIEGTWVFAPNSRSLSPIPIAAYTDGTEVYIYNNMPDGDINVSVVDECGTAVIDLTFSESESTYIVFSIASLDAGTYVLQIDGGDKGFLEGSFVH